MTETESNESQFIKDWVVKKISAGEELLNAVYVAIEHFIHEGFSAEVIKNCMIDILDTYANYEEDEKENLVRILQETIGIAEMKKYLSSLPEEERFDKTLLIIQGKFMGTAALGGDLLELLGFEVQHIRVILKGMLVNALEYETVHTQQIKEFIILFSEGDPEKYGAALDRLLRAMLDDDYDAVTITIEITDVASQMLPLPQQHSLQRVVNNALDTLEMASSLAGLSSKDRSSLFYKYAFQQIFNLYYLNRLIGDFSGSTGEVKKLDHLIQEAQESVKKFNWKNMPGQSRKDTLH